jgi:membrane-associated phospholipid phosphatase
LSKFSFPSGHTATAFSMFFLLALIYNKKGVGLVCCLLAIIAGFSRMYLLQHFLLDVLAGSILGVAITYFLVLKINFLNQPFFQKSLKDVF